MWKFYEPRRHGHTEIFISASLCLRGLFLVFLWILSACMPTPQPEQVIVSTYATSAATPWLSDLYTCAKNSNAVINLSAESPDISLQIGEPETLTSPTYQIGEEEVLIVKSSESSLPDLTLEEAQALFAQGNPSGQVWVYPSGTDIQKSFDQLVMKERSVTSLATVAVSPQKMSEALQSDSSAIGILPRRSLTNNLHIVASAGSVPVLAFTREEPQGVIAGLISCLHGN